MIAFAFGLGALAVAFAGVHGVRLLRADPLDALTAQDRGLIHRSVQAKKTDVGPIGRMAQSLARELGPLMGDAYRRFMTRKIIESGRADYADFAQFMTMKSKLVILGAVPTLLICLYLNFWVAGVAFILALFLIPDIALWSKASERQEEIEDELPDFLDVLAVTVSAGLSFRGALERVIERSDGPLSEEMLLTLRQMDVGQSRTEAFEDLRRRTTSESLESFITALLQSEELGSPLTDALNQIALDMRRVTAQRARQKAARANPKISAVVSLVMVPATMILIGVGMFFAVDIDFGQLFGNLRQ
ncbi:type II secretion system F family protein [Brevibacterium jeotgali]|uniref:Tight adherence protein C n=1 Tax=Brevibacterium jeotgali TaxID=1262550 RepID=A0A2H1L8S5_9MICO|nr:type II secretion system F family protein [Brevibacterium jeotgali]TWB98551.1 tight adherence protein C [Brevibacterium jeotgali]SMY13292.1 tight adherence protein C [Brevibacterium jeotgali]